MKTIRAVFGKWGGRPLWDDDPLHLGVGVDGEDELPSVGRRAWTRR